MVGIFIVILMVISLTAVAGYSIISLQKAADTITLAERNVARMDYVATMIRASSRPLVAGGSVRAPMGDALENGRTGLPRALVGDDRNPWGVRYGYCPQAIGEPLEPGTPSLEVVHGGADYGVGLIEFAGNRYVVEDEDTDPIEVLDESVPPSDVLGFIVSPPPHKVDLPRCDEIIFRDGTFLIGGADGSSPTVGGTVLAIPVATSSLALMAFDLDPALYVALTETGTATGIDPSNAMSLESAVAYWQASRPQSLWFRMADGEYDIGAGLAFISPEGNRFVRLVDATPGVGTGVVLTSSSPTKVQFGIDADLENVSFSPAITTQVLPGARVRIDGSTIGPLEVTGGEVLLSSTASVAAGAGTENSPIVVGAGSLSIINRDNTPFEITSDAADAPAILATGGSIDISADVAAAGNVLPWRITGTASIAIGAKDVAGTMPQASWAGSVLGTVSTRGSVEDTDTDGNNVTVASCPTMQPYVTAASCSSDGVSSGSRLVDADVGLAGAQGWQCDWFSSEVPLVPAPASASISLECSVAP